MRPVNPLMFAATSLALMLVLVAHPAMADTEPNNSLAQASDTLSLGEVMEGSLGCAVDLSIDSDDYYFLEVPENGNIALNLSAPEGLTSRLFLYRTNGVLLTSTSASGTSGSYSLSYDCLGAAVYAVRVQRLGEVECLSYSLSFSLDSPLQVNDQEPNNSIGQINQSLTAGTTLSGQIAFVTNGITDGSDYFNIELEQNGTLEIAIESESHIVSRLYLYRTNGSLVNSDPAQGFEGNHSLTTSCMGAGTYVVRVQGVSGCGGYNLSFSVIEPVHPEDLEPNNSNGAIQESVVEGEVSTGHLGHVFNGATDGSDYFHFEVNRNGTVTFVADLEAGLTARLFVTRTTGVVLFSSPTAGFSGQSSFELPCFGEGTYVVYLSLVSGCGSYSLTYNIEEPLYVNDSEPNNIISQAEPTVMEGSPTTGHLGHDANGTTDFTDYFTIEPTSNGTVTVSLNLEPSLTGRYFLYRPTGALIFASPSSGFTGEESFSVDCLAADTYYIAISRTAGCGSYTFTYSITSPPEANDSEPNNTLSNANETLVEGVQKEGQIGHQSNTVLDNFDYFLLDKDRNGDMSISVQTGNGNTVRLFAYTTTGALLSSSEAAGGTNVDLDVSCRGIETLIVAVGQTSGCGGYILSYQINDPTYAPDQENNNSIANANEVLVSAVVEGHLGFVTQANGTDLSDYYRFEVLEAPFEFEATALAADGLQAQMFVQTTSGAVLASTPSAGFNNTATLSYSFANPGEYIFRVSRVSGCGSYQVNGFCGLIPTASIDVDGALDYCPFNEPTLFGNTGQASYTWTYNNSPFSTDQSIEVDAPGTYSLVTGDLNGCLSQPVEVEAEVIRITGDFNLDGAVNSADLLFLIGEFGCMNDCSTDLDEDGSVTSGDFLLFLSVFGSFCELPDVGF